MSEQEAYDELCAYTLSVGDPEFIHQHVVDAYAAQHAESGDKPIKIVFALAGLYLLLEKKFTGREVQRVHMKMAKQKQQWPVFELPDNRGSITVSDVMEHPEGSLRNKAIHAWCASVWSAYIDSRPVIIDLLQKHAII